MRGTQTYPKGFSPFYAQQDAQQGRGGQIDWSRVTDEAYLSQQFTVKLNGAIAVGADALVVDALTRPLKAGQIIRGADVPTVIVTVDTAGAAANATSVPVTALSDALPSGATIKVGTKKYLTLTANAAKGATSLVVEALATAVVSGDSGTYQGGENNIEVLADAALGATSVTVGNILFPMADNTELKATDFFANYGKQIPQGTIMARTTAGFLIPRSVGVVASGETACGFLYSDADENSRTDAKSGYGLVVGGTEVWENLLPDVLNNGGTMPSLYKAELVANGVIAQFITWKDSRVS